MNKHEREFYSILGRAYIRDGSLSHEGEALLLACLMHTKGPTRAHGNSKDLEDVWRIMRDQNH